MKKLVLCCACMTILTQFQIAFAEAHLTLPFEEDAYPILCGFGEYGGHVGTDYDTPLGTPILAAAAGIALGCHEPDDADGAYGYYVRLFHENGYETRYAHLDSFTGGIDVGVSMNVQKGDIIGYAGNTGCPWYSGGIMIGSCNAYHLHFELRLNGNAIDPYSTNDWQWCDDPPAVAEESQCYEADPVCDCFTPPCDCIVYD